MPVLLLKVFFDIKPIRSLLNNEKLLTLEIIILGDESKYIITGILLHESGLSQEYP